MEVINTMLIKASETNTATQANAAMAVVPRLSMRLSPRSHPSRSSRFCPLLSRSLRLSRKPVLKQVSRLFPLVGFSQPRSSHVKPARPMPLVRLFIQKTLKKQVPLVALQAKLCKVWGTTPQTTKLILTSVDDWTSEQFDEDVYVSVRAKATPERTREVVLGNCRSVQAAFAEHGLIANVRLETYVGESYFHVPPPAK